LYLIARLVTFNCMLRRILLLTVVFPVVLPGILPAQDDIRFQRLSLERGLSQSTIFSIAQDRKGFMWFATQDGLNRYDGYVFIRFGHDDLDSTSLSDNYVNAVLEDRTGSLWAGTRGGGLNRYSAGIRGFLHYRTNPANAHSLSHDEVRCLFEDRNGALWVGTSDGLNRYDAPSDNFTRYRRTASGGGNPPGNIIDCLFEDRNGILWVGLQGVLAQFDRTTGHFSEIRLPDQGALCTSIFEDDNGILWVAAQDQLYLLVNKRLVPASRALSVPAPLLARRILKDGSGRIWFGADDGLRLYDKNTGRITSLRNDPTNPRGLSGNSVLSLFEDRQGIIWVGTYDGINKYAPAEFKFRHVKWSSAEVRTVGWNKIRSFAEDKRGTIWVATQEGLMTYDRRNDRLERFATDLSAGPAAATRLVWSLLEDIDDPQAALWVGTNGQGLVHLRTNRSGAAEITRYLPRVGNVRSISGPSPVALHRMRNGDLWAGTLWEGLNRFDRKAKTFTRYVNDPDDPASISGNEIWALCEDKRGFLWVGTAGEGLNRLDVSTGKFLRFRHDPLNPRSLSDDKVLSIIEDRNGILWIGTYAGLNRFDPSTDTFEHFTVRNGLPNDVVYGIVEDRKGNLWLSTNKGLSRFTPATREFRTFDAADGLQSNEFNHGAAYRCRDGSILFGGVDGFNIVFPDSLMENRNVPAVVLTDFKIFNKPVIPSTNEKRLTTDIADAQSISLSFEDAVLSFGFAALEYTNSAKNQYAYRMEGFDGDWVHAGSRREATYTNLDPGIYTFRVKAANGDGVWSSTTASLVITISPPFWQTWWFRFAIILGFLSIGPIIYYRRVSGLKKKQITQQQFSHRLLEEQERERQRIAGELHDSLGQDLLVVKNRASLGLRASGRTRKAKEQFEEISQIVSRTLQDVRRISHNLRPYQLDRLGLSDTLRSAVQNVESSFKIRIKTHVDPLDNLLPPEAEINVFRIVQEGLNNIVKHSAAKEAEISVTRTNGLLVIRIRDNGKGFHAGETTAPGAHSFGLTGIHQRVHLLGGTCVVTSAPRRGTLIDIAIPLQRDKA
jgi:signal transduction histidine kinase/ligand-binding sensor domain-containing protein